MNSSKIKEIKNTIEQTNNPTENESPEDFCNRIPHDNGDIITCLYYHSLVQQKDEGETDEGETRWTDKANKMFVGNSGSIRDIKQREFKLAR